MTKTAAMRAVSAGKSEFRPRDDKPCEFGALMTKRKPYSWSLTCCVSRGTSARASLDNRRQPPLAPMGGATPGRSQGPSRLLERNGAVF